MFHLLNNLLHLHRSRAEGTCTNSTPSTSLKVPGGNLRHSYGNAIAAPGAHVAGYGWQRRGGTYRLFWSLAD